MPPVQALAALHGAWLVLLLPPTVWMMRRWPARRLWLTGIALTTIGVVGLAALAGRDLLIWFSWTPPAYQRYVVQRILFAIATATDLPLVQLTVVGMVCWVVGKQRRAMRTVPSVNLLDHRSRRVQDGRQSAGAEVREQIAE
jgi:hypothetical protein